MTDIEPDEDQQWSARRGREKQTRVAIGCVCALVAVTFFRYGMSWDHEPPEPVFVPSATPAPALGVGRELVVEFELVIGDDTYDVSDDPIVVKGGAGSLLLEENPTQRTAGDGYHFTHRNTVSVVSSESMVIASVGGITLRLQTMSAKLSDAEHRRALARALTGAGQTVGKPRPITRRIAGRDQEGITFDTTTPMRVEAYLVKVGEQRVGALLYRQDPRLDMSQLDALLDSIAEGPGQPMPEFTARVGAMPMEVFLDRPVRLPLTPPITATLRRRAMVLRTMVGQGGSLTFEHPPNLNVTRTPSDQGLAVTLQSDRVAIQLYDLPVRFTVDELARSLGGATGEVTHASRGQIVKGRKVRLTNTVEHEIYVFERGGKTIGASIQYLAAHERRAVEIAMPILLSVK